MIAKPPLFSIITPSYNHGHFIERTIRSVIEQDVNLKYFVIDGGSTDHTLDILKKYDDKYDNFHYVSEADNSQSNTINKGMRMAKGDIIAYINSDDYYEPGALKKVQEYFQAHPECHWLYGKCRIVDKEDREIRPVFSKVKNLLSRRYSYFKLLTMNIFSQPSTFWSKEVVRNIGLFSEGLHLIMDYEYWCRIGTKYQGYYLPELLSNYRYYDDTKSGSSFVSQYWQELHTAAHYSKGVNKLAIPLHFCHFLVICTLFKLFKLFKK